LQDVSKTCNGMDMYSIVQSKRGESLQPTAYSLQYVTISSKLGKLPADLGSGCTLSCTVHRRSPQVDADAVVETRPTTPTPSGRMKLVSTGDFCHERIVSNTEVLSQSPYIRSIIEVGGARSPCLGSDREGTGSLPEAIGFPCHL
jgi:hypothetical protein